MKKILVISMCIALVATFTACGNDSSEPEAVEEEIVLEEEPEEIEVEEEEPEYISANFYGLLFSYPDNCEYSETESYATITIAEGEKGISIMAHDESELGDLAEAMFAVANSSILNGFDDVQDREDYDTTLAGLDAKGTTAVVTTSGVVANYTITTIYDEATKFIYSICYMTAPGADDDDTVYLEFLDSISIEPAEIEEADEEEEEDSVDESVPSEYLTALKSAESYNKTMHMSKQRLYDQLTSEYGGKFDADAAQYAVDNLDADWYDNALQTAQSYSDTMHMSKQRLFDQLTSEYGEKFTEDEAQYAVDNVDADWNYNALETARSYRDNMSMSSSAIHDQLTSAYGEKFTEEEADYAIANLD